MNPTLHSFDDAQSLRGAPLVTLRPISAIAATRRGGVPEARIMRILIDLAEPLTALHAEGRIHGGISNDSIGLDANGRADLILPPSAFPRSAGDRALRDGRASGFNAFEQYTDDPAWAVGPWTDVYALCAAACRLITGISPPSAIDRCIRDGYIPLVERNLDGYDRLFLAGLDQGLALRPDDRPASIAELLIATGMDREIAARGCQPQVDVVPTDENARAVASFPASEGSTIVVLSNLNGQQNITSSSSSGASERQAPMSENASMALPTLPRQDGTQVSETPVHPVSRARLRHAWLFILAGLLVAVLGVWLWLGGNTAASPMLRSGDSNGSSGPGVEARVLPGANQIAGIPTNSNGSAADTTDDGFAADATEDGAKSIAASPLPTSRVVVAPVRIGLKISPWGEVLVNGVSRGVSPPLRSISLAAGTYQVSVRNPNAPTYSMTLKVTPGKRGLSINHHFANE